MQRLPTYIEAISANDKTMKNCPVYDKQRDQNIPAEPPAVNPCEFDLKHCQPRADQTETRRLGQVTNARRISHVPITQVVKPIVDIRRKFL